MVTQDERNNRNQAIIEEFRQNGGKVGGRFADVTILLLTTVGAKSGQRRINPLACVVDRDRWLVFGSKGGAPNHPDWYHNLVANPDVTVELGSKTFEATAVPLEGAERDRLYATQAENSPVFATYQQNTTRVIPVVALTRKT